MNTWQIAFFVLLSIFILAAGLSIGFFLGKTNKRLSNMKTRVTPLQRIIDLFKFIWKCETIILPGKVNYSGGVLIILTCLVLALPLTFSLIYTAIFGKYLIDANLITYIIIYFVICCLPISLVEVVIHYKQSRIN